MPEYLGGIEIPTVAASGTFPVAVEWGHVRVHPPSVAVHQFGSANRKIEQRFLLGNGSTQFTIRCNLSHADRIALLAFWEARKGSYGSFTFDCPNEDGDGTTAFTCHFANEPLSVEHLAAALSSTGITLIGVPSEYPTYTLNATQTRFPSGSLPAALLSQEQQFIPLLKIQAKETGYSAIYVSDRRCTVGAQLYQARLLRFDGISQGINGETDQASFSFGNADRVMRDLANDTDLRYASIEFSLFHVGTGIKLDFWKGELTSWSLSEGPEFQIQASDSAHELNLHYPTRRVDRRCWKDFNDGVNCPYATAGNGGGHTTCDKSFAACDARGMSAYHGGIPAKPQGVRIRNNGTSGRPWITATSLVSDDIYGMPLPEVYTDVAMPVNCLIAAGREESDFYRALGIVGAGPIGSYSDTLADHRLDGQSNHGPGALGIRRSYGHDPVQDTDPDSGSDLFSLNAEGTEKAAGVAFIEILRTDPKGVQPSRTQDHQMQAVVQGGIGGWYWTDASTRAWAASITNPIWVAVNGWLKVKNLQAASASAQVETFDVTAAIAAAAICSDTVTKVIGDGTETQFKFLGTIGEWKPFRDWLEEILANCLGYYTFANGKLKLGLRYNSSAVEAFTAGNVILDSLQLAPLDTRFNHFSVHFGDAEYEWQPNIVTIDDIEHAKRIGSSTAPLFTKGEMNLVGTATKSQAARIAVTRLREELGGITEAEQWAARQGTFKTTVLALAVEPGMVCSLTHEDMPGGAGEFRVTRWRLNGDYSIDIEFRSTTDSMYDLTIGEKPADVVADALPTEYVADPVPGDVQAIGADAFQIVKTEDGTSATLDLTYSPPGTDSTDIGTFAAIAVHVEAPDASGAVLFAGNHDYNGDPDGVGSARYGTAQIKLPMPTAGAEDWRIYICSRSRTGYSKKLVLNGGTGESPNATVNVAQATTPGLATPTQPESTDWSVAVESYRTELGGKPVAQVRVTIPFDDASITHFRVWTYKSASPPATPDLFVDRAAQAKGAAGTTVIDMWIDREDAEVAYQVAVTACSDVMTVFPDALTPVKTVTITVIQPATQISGFSVDVIEEDRAGVPSGRFRYNFTAPDEPEYQLARIERIATDATFTPLVGASYGLVEAARYPREQDTAWPLPTAAEYWTFKASSVSWSEIINTTSPPTYNVTVPASAGVEAISIPVPQHVTLTSIEVIERFVDANGKQKQKLAFRGTPPDPLGNFTGVHVYGEIPDGVGTGNRFRTGSNSKTGTARTSLPRQPLDFGSHNYDASEPYLAVWSIDDPGALTARFYAPSIGGNSLRMADQSSPSPSLTIALTANAPILQGEEYAAKEAASATDPVGTANEEIIGGKKKNTFTVTWTPPSDPRYIGCRIYYRFPNGDIVPLTDLVPASETSHYFELDAPSSIQAGHVYILSVGPGGTNTYVAGWTPEHPMTIGTTDGTLDLGQTIADSIAEHLGVVSGVLGVLPNAITEELVQNYALTNISLADGAAITRVLADGAVDTGKLADLAVAAGKLADSAVTEGKIANLAVASAKLADSAVTEGKIADLAVAAAKLADNSVTGTKIADLAVEAAKLADSSVTATKIANAAVGSAAIANAAVGSAAIANAAVGSAAIANAAVGSAAIANLAVGSAAINNAAITDAKLDHASANRIAIVNADIVSLAANKITAQTLAVGVVYSGTINATQVNAGLFNGHSLQLSLNGFTSKITNDFDATVGAYAGLTIQLNSSNLRTVLHQSGMSVVSSTGSLVIGLQLSSGSPVLAMYDPLALSTRKIEMSVASFGGRVNLWGSSAGLFIEGNQVVGLRGSSVTAPTGGATQDAEARTAINTIISRLQAHGLIS